jgi:hypothetical protein
MKKIVTKICALSILMIGLSGCFLKSVHPLITAEQAILIDKMDGVYENDDQRWTFASDKNPTMMAEIIGKYPGEDLSFDSDEGDSLGVDVLGVDVYLVLYEDKQDLEAEPIVFIGSVGKINGDLFINLKILDVVFGQSGQFIDSHRFNVNTFSKIQVDDESFVMEPFASGWIKDQIENNRVRIKHEVVYSDLDESSEILITASTKELQTFVQKYGKEAAAYEDPITMKRIPDGIQ